MGKLEEYYHDEIIAEQEGRDEDYEQMYFQQAVEEVAKACAKDATTFEYFLQRMHHHAPLPTIKERYQTKNRCKLDAELAAIAAGIGE